MSAGAEITVFAVADVVVEIAVFAAFHTERRQGNREEHRFELFKKGFGKIKFATVVEGVKLVAVKKIFVADFLF